MALMKCAECGQEVSQGHGSVRLVAEIVPDTGPAFTHTATRVLRPGEREIGALDFPEAVMGPHYNYRCSGEASP